MGFFFDFGSLPLVGALGHFNLRANRLSALDAAPVLDRRRRATGLRVSRRVSPAPL
jgi:hypothetical protein